MEQSERDLRTEVEQSVLRIVRENLADDSITLETRLVEDAGADSLDLAELEMELEDEFDIYLPATKDARMSLQTIIEGVLPLVQAKRAEEAVRDSKR